MDNYFRKVIFAFVFSLICLLTLIRCGSDRSSFHSNLQSKISKAGRLGSNDINFSLISSTSNNQLTPRVAFNNLSGHYLLVFEDRRYGNSDIYGELIYTKYFPGVTTSYSFPKEIRSLIAYNQFEAEIPQSQYSVSGLGTSSVTVSGLPANTFLVFITKDFSIAGGSATQKNPAVAFGCDNTSGCRYLVVWEENSSGQPFIKGSLLHVYGSNLSSSPVSSLGAYTYTSSSYNLASNVSSFSQTEPDVTFDDVNKRFYVAWVDASNLEKKYRFSPRGPLVPDIVNTSIVSTFNLYSSFSPLYDNSLIVFRKFEVNGTADGGVELYSDVAHKDNMLSADVNIDNANSIIKIAQRAYLYKNETRPKIAINHSGEPLIGFLGRRLEFKVMLNYSSNGSSAITKGPYAYSLDSATQSQTQLFVRAITPMYNPKNHEKKLYNNPYGLDQGIDTNIQDSSIISLSGDKFLVIYSTGDKLRKVEVDVGNFTVSTAVDLISDSTKVIKGVSVARALAGHYLIAYEEYDPALDKYEIKGLFLKSSGDKDGNPFKIPNNSSNKNLPSVAPGDSLTNRFLTVYQDDRNGTFFSSNLDIFGNFYSRQVVLKPQLFLPQTSIDFGSVYTNQTSIQSYVIENTGDGELNVNSIISTALPIFTPVETSATVDPSSSKNLNVRFLTGAAGSFTGFLNLSSNSFQNPKQSIRLRGNAVYPPEIELVSDISDFVIEGYPLLETNRFAAKYGYGISPYTWQVNSPSFLTFSKISSFSASSRDRIVLRGTPVGINPPQTGSVISVNLILKDKNNKEASYQKDIRVYPTLSLNDTTLPDASQGSSYSYTLNASGGRGAGNYAFSNISSANFPGKLSTLGLSLNTNTGLISGTPKFSGTFAFEFKLCDKDISSYCVNKTIGLKVNKTLFITSDITSIYAGKSVTLQASGGTAPYTWSSGNLPSAFNLTPSGVFKAYSTASKGTYSFRLRVTDNVGAIDEKDYNVEVKKLSINTVSTANQNAMVGKQYSLALSATDNLGAMSWSVDSGQLPPGLILESNTGIIFGTPTTANLSGYSVTIKVTDSDNNSDKITLNIKVYPQLNLSLTNLPSEWTEGVEINSFAYVPFESRVSGHNYVFSITPSNLNGLGILKFGNYSGNVKGTPSSTGDFNYVIEVKDNLGFNASSDYSLKINPKPQIVSTGDIVIFQNYSSNNHFSFNATGGTGNLSFSMSPANYNGIKIDAQGRLYGKATVLDTSGTNVTITVTDNTGASANKSFIFTILPSISISTDPVDFPAKAMVGKSYNVKFIASGGPLSPSAYTYNYSGNIGGLGFTTLSNQGVLQGIPTQFGDYSFSVSASKGSVSVTNSYSVSVYPEIKINDFNLPNAIKGKPYNHSLNISGGSNVFSNYSASMVFVGDNPGGVNITKAGLIYGTPVTSGSYSVKVKVFDKQVGSEYYDEKTLSFNVYNQPTFGNISSFGTLYAGQTVQLQVEAVNGLAPYSYNLVGGNLPQNLSLASNGSISGKISESAFGNYSVIVKAKDALNIESDAKKFRFYVSKMTLSGSLSNSAMVGRSYVSFVTINGGSAPYSAEIVGNPIAPPNLTALVSGNNVIIQGTPTEAGSYNFKIKVTDIKGAQEEESYSLTVYQNLEITNTALSAGIVSQSYLAQINVIGGTGSFNNYSTSAGLLPPGIILSKTTGTLTGTPTTKGIYNFTIQVKDSANFTASRNLSISVYDKLNITTTTLPTDWYHNDDINYQINTTGGSGQQTWQIISGSLPSGLSLNSSNGIISGKINTSGTFNFTIGVTDIISGDTDSQNYTVLIKNIPIAESSAPPYFAMVGKTFSLSITTTDTNTPHTFEIENGSVPGLSLITFEGKGILSGVPTQKGDYQIRVRVTDRDGHYSEKDYLITVYEELRVVNAQLKEGKQGQAYVDQLTVLGGVVSGFSNYSTWAVGLPDGLVINKEGEVTGVPKVGGSFGLKIKVKDTKGFESERDYTLNIQEMLKITNTVTALFEGDTINLISDGGTAPYIYTSANLPSVFTLTTSGQLTLTGPASTGSVYQFRIKVTDAGGVYSEKDFNIAVSGITISETTGSKYYTIVGENYGLALNAQGGVGAIVWSVSSGALPPGLILNPFTGSISGITSNPGSYTFEITATDSAGHSAKKSYTVNVYDQINITPTSLPNITIGTSYSQTIGATGGTGIYYFSMNSSNGLSINSSTGEISGTPLIAGSYIYTVSVVDSLGFTASRSFTIIINEQPRITTADTVYLYTGEVPEITLSVQNGTSPYIWSVLSGSVTGLTFNNDGTLSGTPAAGDYNVTIGVTDSSGISDTKTVNFKVINKLNITSVPSGTSFSAIANIPFKVTFTGAGGIGAYGWSMTGSIPGVSLISIAGEGILSGSPSQTGDYALKIILTDSKGNKKELDIVITVYPELKINNAALKNAVVDIPYSDNILASGGAGTYSYSIVSGSLPAGLSLNGTTGVISGTPTESGVRTIKIAVTDTFTGYSVEKDLILNSYSRPIITTNPNLGTVYNGQVLNIQLASSLGSSTTYTYSQSSGSMPTGLILDSNGSISGKINAATGVYSFSIISKDSNGIESLPVTFSITVATIGLNTSNYITTGMVNRDYASSIIISGGTEPFDIKLIPETTIVPPGITVDVSGSFITIKGKPNQAGSYSFNLILTDSKSAQITQNLTLNVLEELTFDRTTIPSAVVSIAYLEQLTVSGGNQTSLNFIKKSGSLPQGITLSTGGLLSGTPLAIGSFTFTVKVTDGSGFTAEKEYTLTVVDKARLTVEKDSYYFSANKPITPITVNVSGGASPYSFNVTGLPSGINYQLTDKGISILGTPLISGSFTVTVTVTDNSSTTDTKVITINVSEITIDSSGLIAETDINSDYFAMLTATGGSTTPVYEWNIEYGVLPDGLTLNQNTGIISGKPTKEGIYTFTIKVTDKNSGVYATKVLEIKIVGDLIAAKDAGSWKCFIATAAYGSYLDPHVVVLRQFRDRYLLTSSIGRRFVEFYYTHSPALAKVIAENYWLKLTVRAVLTPVVYFIKYLNFMISLPLLVIIAVSIRKKIRK